MQMGQLDEFAVAKCDRVASKIRGLALRQFMSLQLYYR